MSQSNLYSNRNSPLVCSLENNSTLDEVKKNITNHPCKYLNEKSDHYVNPYDVSNIPLQTFSYKPSHTSQYENRSIGQPLYEETSSNSSKYDTGVDETYLKSKSINLSSLSLDQDNYWDRESPIYMETYAALPEPHIYQDTNFLLGNFSKLGKNSPSPDQGYHTLAPQNSSLTTSWSEKSSSKGKQYKQKNNSFDRLPDELIVKIFSFLSSTEISLCARVCRRFSNLAWSPQLWRCIKIKGDFMCADKALKRVLKKLGNETNGLCAGIERIEITDGAKLTDKSLALIAKKCPDLAYLQMQGCTTITNSGLIEVTTKCENLQHLDISGCIRISSISISMIPYDPLRRLNLQYIDLTDCPFVQDNTVRVIVCHSPQLTFFYLRRCMQITDLGLKVIPSFCPNLKELSVSDCINVTDFGLYELAKLGPTLRYLSVAKCSQVSDAGLKVIAKRCYKLRYLNCRGCEAVSDDAIVTLARTCTRLRALDIGKCDVSDISLQTLAENCPNLKKISLRNCDMITDKGIQYLAYFCRGLQQLNIQDCQISLEGYRAVKKYCKRCVIEHTNPVDRKSVV